MQKNLFTFIRPQFGPAVCVGFAVLHLTILGIDPGSAGEPLPPVPSDRDLACWGARSWLLPPAGVTLTGDPEQRR